MQREHLFTSMKVSGVGWAQGEDVGSNTEASLGSVRTFGRKSERAKSISATATGNSPYVLSFNKE